jgi:hypothetical protein
MWNYGMLNLNTSKVFCRNSLELHRKTCSSSCCSIFSWTHQLSNLQLDGNQKTPCPMQLHSHGFSPPHYSLVVASRQGVNLRFEPIIWYSRLFQFS